MTVTEKIQPILENKFEMRPFVELVMETFSSMTLINPNGFTKEFSNFSSHIEGHTNLGEYHTPDNDKVCIYAVKLKTNSYVENSRAIQRSYAKKLIENSGSAAAIVAFYTEGDKKWRLSFVRLDYEIKFEGGRFSTNEKITPARRYSFLVGENEPCHTAIERFEFLISDKNSTPTISDIEEAFSVEKVTDEFFKLYCEKFYQLECYLSSNQQFMDEANHCGFTSEQFAKKLMGQIVFLYFLQKKGWLGVRVWNELTESEYNTVFYNTGATGRIIKEHLPTLYRKTADGKYRFTNISALENIPDDEEMIIANAMSSKNEWGTGSQKFLRTLFDFASNSNKRFYKDILEPIFYNTLNCNRGPKAYCCITHSRIPFLSGGLFDPIKGYDWKHTDINIPDEIFSNPNYKEDKDAGILDIFDRYNFTIAEDEPLEREVAIDPEMLGRSLKTFLT